MIREFNVGTAVFAVTPTSGKKKKKVIPPRPPKPVSPDTFAPKTRLTFQVKKTLNR